MHAPHDVQEAQPTEPFEGSQNVLFQRLGRHPRIIRGAAIPQRFGVHSQG